MKTSNLATEALRVGEVGQCWEEVITGSTGTIQVPRFATFRVRAGAGTTVTIGGKLAMTMASGEIAIFNAGYGDPAKDALGSSGTTIVTVPVVVAVASCWVQVARENKRTI